MGNIDEPSGRDFIFMKLIPLSQKSKTIAGKYFAKVDDEDYEHLNKYVWQAHFSKRQNRVVVYATRGEYKDGVRSYISMHRQILGLTDPNIKCDHKNHDGLDNQRQNLRACTSAENSKNRIGWGTSKFLGVSRSKIVQKYKKKNGEISIYISHKWRAQIMKNKKVTLIGVYHSEIEAAKAYDEAALKYHGDFANVNFK